MKNITRLIAAAALALGTTAVGDQPWGCDGPPPPPVPQPTPTPTPTPSPTTEPCTVKCPPPMLRGSIHR
jgi:hypothetical protein